MAYLSLIDDRNNQLSRCEWLCCSYLTFVYDRISVSHSSAPTPDSPQPYPSFQPGSSSLFPAWSNELAPPLKLQGLPGFMREYNRSHNFRMHVWSYRPCNEASLAPPVIVRFMIRDILIIYLTLDTATDGSLITESVTAFGPREKVRYLQI